MWPPTSSTAMRCGINPTREQTQPVLTEDGNAARLHPGAAAGDDRLSPRRPTIRCWTTIALQQIGRPLEQAFGAAERARYWQIFSDRGSSGPRGLPGRLATVSAPVSTTIHSCSTCRSTSWNTHFRPCCIPAHWRPWRTWHRWETPVVLSTATWYSSRARSNAPGSGAPSRAASSSTCTRSGCRPRAAALPGGALRHGDDKPNPIGRDEIRLGAKLTTVFVRQGHYALAAQSNAGLPAPDRAIERSATCQNLNISDFQVHP